MSDYWLKYTQTLAQAMDAVEVWNAAGEALPMSSA